MPAPPPRLPFFLRTRVARRLVGLFVISALVPISLLAAVSWTAVTRELERQSEQNLSQLARNAGQSILQQITSIEGALAHVGREREGAEARAASVLATVPSVVSISRVAGDGSRQLAGPPVGRLDLPAAGLRDGHRILAGSTPARVFLAVPYLPGERDGGHILAEVEVDSLWAPGRTFAALPGVASFCVIRGVPRFDYCSDGDAAPADAFRAGSWDGPLGVLLFENDDGRHVAGRWSFHPMAMFDAPPWTVLVTARADEVYAPLEGFAYWFVPALVLGFGVALLLSNVEVRRTMQPLEDLGKGTARISAGDFSARVPIESSDEFGALAQSFNEMATQIGDQLGWLAAGRAIDRAALGGFDVREVVEATIAEVPKLVPSRSVSIVLEGVGSSGARVYWRVGQDELGGTDHHMTAADREWLAVHAHHGILDGSPLTLEVVARRGQGLGPLTVFPLVAKGRSLGALIIETEPRMELPRRAVQHLRQLANQIAVACDDARLVKELEDMGWGAIRALARAIDAKSRWTAGHSERVTTLSLRLGRDMGLPSEKLEVLHRGGLLHDIGKIGVPRELLDLDGQLTPEQLAVVRRHPVIGARILEPIRAFAPALPIVLQHHERWDGRGYPQGLSGTEIDPLARVVAVADSFDAMASARPYRASLEFSVIVREIVEGAGRQFDPEVVTAFRRIGANREALVLASPEGAA